MNIKDRNELRDLRQKLFDEDPYCYWCKRLLDPPVDGGTDTTVSLDHLNSKYGEKGFDGCVVACRKCNSLRGGIELKAADIIGHIRRRGSTFKKLKKHVSKLARLSKQFTERVKTGRENANQTQRMEERKVS